MTDRTRAALAAAPLCLLVAFLAAGLPAAAQTAGTADELSSDERSRIEQRKRLTEEEQIRLRREWFESTRTAGTDSALERARLRLEAVNEVRERIRAQRELQAAGRMPTENVWIEMGPSPSGFGGWSFGTVTGRITAIAADWNLGTLYVGTAAGGFWRSDNDGADWTHLFDFAGTLTVGAAAIDPTDPDTLWVGTGDYNSGCEGYFGIGVLRSTDGGQTWEPRNGTDDLMADVSSFSDLVVDPRDGNNVIAGGDRRGCADGSNFAAGIYTTTDGGLTWTQRLSTSVHGFARDPGDADVVWAATSAGIYKTIDNGVSWNLQSASGLPTSPGRCEIAIAPSDGNVVYAQFTGSIWRTLDGGASWAQVSSGSDACDGQCSYNMTFGVDALDPNTVYRGNIRLFKSTDGGLNWSDLINGWGGAQKVHQDIQELLMHPTQAGEFYVGSDGGLWKSSNGGSAFTNRNGDLNVTQFYAIDVDEADPGNICGGAQDNSSLARNGSDVWQLQAVTGDGFVCQYNPVETNYHYIASYPSGGFPSVWRSTSGPFGGFGGVTNSANGIIGGDRINWVTPYVLDPIDPEILWLGTHRLYRSTNHGSTWVRVGPDDLTGGSGSLFEIEVNRNFPERVFTGSQSGRVWTTPDDGLNWFDLTSGLPGRAINDIAADPADPDRALAVVGGFNTAHLWEWNDGSGWTAIGAGLPNVPANTVLMLNSTDVFVGNDVGVYRSVDGGATFQPYMAGMPVGMVVTDLVYNQAQNVVTAGTYARGAWQVPVGAVGPILIFESVQQPLTEIDGDGDANVEPGETWGARVVMRNGGGEPALDATARLATDKLGIEVQDGGTFVFPASIPSGAAVLSDNLVPFVVEQAADCTTELVFDLEDVTTSNNPLIHPSRSSILSLELGDGYEPPTEENVLAVDFDGDTSSWTHAAVLAGVPPCAGIPNVDEWGLDVKEAARGLSYHAGNGPGNPYGKRAFGWLYYNGKDSDGGAGLTIPADVIGATLRITHWYDTKPNSDGAQVVVDSVDNGQDVYNPLTPVGGYPAGTITTGICNGLEGMQAFHGDSGGWVTHEFDLLPYRGTTIWPAFVFGSSFQNPEGEGWYIDEVEVDVLVQGDRICDVQEWPGAVPGTLTLDLQGDGTIVAAWGDACNVGILPTQQYSIQAGDLDALRATGGYTHAPAEDRCDRTSPSVLTPGAGNLYFLAVANESDRDGLAGRDSAGNERPVGSGSCGIRRDGSCP